MIEIGSCREKTVIKDLGKMKTVLGMNIAREDDGSITLSHPAVVDELLSTAGLTDSRPTLLGYVLACMLN